ncbi:MAG TPA: UDP-N-acetylmuramoyl-L-alanyl-D-glutamate--2,6-diaminopimelate ligase [Candidatus Acidoferrales bacterium]|nr:UDP-N-acetylmuramoyl-L-alanyl-D-glutamate--2,6-diaminopimelate ligase [Candidatus Acidoferrales bacterium]
MKLRDLLLGIEVGQVSGPADAEIQTVVYDSRNATAGSLFFALHGEKLDGTKFVGDALKRGAIAIASDEAWTGRPVWLAKDVTWIGLLPGSERRGLARVAANWYGHPTEALKLVGVTGTNGKTTTTFLVDSILRAAGHTTGLIGTTGYRTPKGSRAAGNTTPESLDLQQMFAEVRDAGGTHVVLEASSHALAMERLFGCHFAVAIFTNLTRDHLDYHKTFEDYFAAKRLLFEGTGAGAPDVAVINADDTYSAQLSGFAGRTMTYGLNTAADLVPTKLNLSFHGLEFTAETPAGNIEVQSKLVGRINVCNILAAIGAGIGLNIPAAKISEGIANLDLVPGRFQSIDEGQPFLVVVDYAHTDDALRNLISTARELNSTARIITVFGAGGERDRTKRPLMGEAAGSLSDLVVLTSDNPRGEDPLRIINDVVVGLQKVNANYRIEPDREQALAAALEEARPGDIVLLAGKGHETYQVLASGTIDFDDREKAREILRRKGYSKVEAR